MSKPYHQILRESISESVRVQTQLEQALYRSESLLRDAELNVRRAFYQHLNDRNAPLARGVINGYCAVFGAMPFSDKSRDALIEFASRWDASWDFIREGSSKAYRFNWRTALPHGHEELGRILDHSSFGLHFAAAIGAHTASGRKQLNTLASQAVAHSPQPAPPADTLARQIASAMTECLALRGLIQHHSDAPQGDVEPVADDSQRAQSPSFR